MSRTALLFVVIALAGCEPKGLHDQTQCEALCGAAAACGMLPSAVGTGSTPASNCRARCSLSDSVFTSEGGTDAGSPSCTAAVAAWQARGQCSEALSDLVVHCFEGLFPGVPVLGDGSVRIQPSSIPAADAASTARAEGGCASSLPLMPFTPDQAEALCTSCAITDVTFVLRPRYAPSRGRRLSSCRDALSFGAAFTEVVAGPATTSVRLGLGAGRSSACPFGGGPPQGQGSDRGPLDASASPSDGGDASTQEASAATVAAECVELPASVAVAVRAGSSTVAAVALDASVCVARSACGADLVEACSDGVDNDGNGRTDCRDPACAGSTECSRRSADAATGSTL